MERGTLLNNKYEILKKIGSGGMSSVYLAMDVSLHRQWAIKEIKKTSGTKSALFNAAITEANLMKNLDYPTLPRVVDIFENKSGIFVVMDYIDGISLARFVKIYGTLNEKKVLYIARKLADTLIYLHSKNPPIIHRDLKPGNIMITGEGNIKLIDFGIAREYKEKSVQDTSFLGTKGYAAPEQLSGKGQTDARTDIYALGVTLYSLLTGKNPSSPPYEIKPIRQWNPDFSKGLEQIIEKCVKDDPDLRYQDAKSLKYALFHVKEEDPLFIRKIKRRLRIFIATTGLCLFLFTGAAGLQIYGNNAKNEDFDINIQKGNLAINAEEKIGYFETAIDIRPGDIKGYEGLINIFKEDALFTIKEEERLNKNLNLNISFLKNDDNYGKLAYQLGKLYWYYYDYGNDKERISAIKSSIVWFEDATRFLPGDSKEYKVALVYSKIGEFIRDIALNIEEANDKGKYIEYFSELNNLKDITKEENNEIVRLSSINLLVSSLNSYAAKFREDGVDVKEIDDFYNEMILITNSTVVNVEKTRKLKNDLQYKLYLTKDTIGLVYGDKE